MSICLQKPHDLYRERVDHLRYDRVTERLDAVLPMWTTRYDLARRLPRMLGAGSGWEPMSVQPAG